MARSIHRRWTADDVTKLRQLAGRHPRNAIAAQLGRGPSALAVKAHQLNDLLRGGTPLHSSALQLLSVISFRSRRR